LSRDPTQGKAGKRADQAGILRSLASVYSSWKSFLINGVFFLAYYLFFYTVITGSNSGFFLLTIPFPLLVLLVLASSILATVAASYLRLPTNRNVLPGLAQSPAGVALGALAASCACSIPLLAPLLYFIGLNAIEVSGVVSFLASYQEDIIVAIVALDALSIYYYLRLISRTGLTRGVP
jgi:hypothetical protein